MNITDLRKVAYEFGSPEWLEYISNNNVLRPLIDRRKTIEGTNDQQQVREDGTSERRYVRILLTPAERNLIQDIYLSDLG